MRVLTPEILSPVYVDDIIGEVAQATSDFVISRVQGPGSTIIETTLLDQIKANETDALGSTSLIQQIRYSKSSFFELIETLGQADKSGEERFNKYPLIHLVQDISIDRGDSVNVFGTANLNIILAHHTVQSYKITDRDALVFKPVLWPIYYEFMRQLKLSAWVMGNWDETGEFRHRVIKRAFWGNRKLESSKNVLNDYVDAIEIQNLQVKFNYSNCK